MEHLSLSGGKYRLFRKIDRVSQLMQSLQARKSRGAPAAKCKASGDGAAHAADPDE